MCLVYCLRSSLCGSRITVSGEEGGGGGGIIVDCCPDIKYVVCIIACKIPTCVHNLTPPHTHTPSTFLFFKPFRIVLLLNVNLEYLFFCFAVLPIKAQSVLKLISAQQCEMYVVCKLFLLFLDQDLSKRCSDIVFWPAD